MYTELYICCKIKKELPGDVLAILNHLFSENWPKITSTELPEHEFFKCDRWSCIGSMASYYFVPESINLFKYDDIGNYYTLISRSDLKNYDNEIAKFIDWLMPYIEMDSGDYIGHYRYEEDIIPTLLFKE